MHMFPWRAFIGNTGSTRDIRIRVGTNWLRWNGFAVGVACAIALHVRLNQPGAWQGHDAQGHIDPDRIWP